VGFYLGMDAGGTKTNVIITDEHGNIVGRGKGGMGNHQNGKETAFQSYRVSIDEALSSSGLRREDIEFAVFGLAGADREADFQILRPAVHELGFENHFICVDAAISMRAGASKPYGVSLICGTGTNCVGMSRTGEVLQVGGFGYIYGDFGGGGDLCREVFRAVIRAWDGRGPQTKLTGLTLEMLGFESVSAMYDHFLDENKNVPVDLARLLFPAVQAGDSVAKQILERQGTELGKAARAAVLRLELQDEEFDVVLAGSIVTRGEDSTIAEQIGRIVGEVAPKHRIVKLRMEPVVGAIFMAMDRAGVAVTSQVYEKLSTFQMV
jgi:N-acetylglucosamine kinase-like BadF-type ATPase